METPRYTYGRTTDGEEYYIVDIPFTEYNSLQSTDRDKHRIVGIRIGGAVSPALARIWASQITEQLNRFDIVNASVAKLTGIP